ncbi:unnamed protein product [Eruca vesicaria subsp. sativa]|uniref:Uncharacterized protein n=1 Tax=Eruca vesicaria subsp. sativa TaxID=29727 RepID=A0ABC8IUS9_ERUVS|nr:unnamed protein product [Eruca vesicaria subsp. sativa]
MLPGLRSIFAQVCRESNHRVLLFLRLSSPPYDYSPSSSFSTEPSPDISPLKRSSPVSDESDQPKRRRISLQDPIFITSPLSFIYPETQPSSIDDPTHASPVPEKETSPFASKSLETEDSLLYNTEMFTLFWTWYY